MKQWMIVVGAFGALAAAKGAREVARDVAAESQIDEPWAPSPQSAPVVSVGYRELGADLLFLRLIGYYGGRKNTPEGVTALVEAIVAMDPNYLKMYRWGASAIMFSARNLAGDDFNQYALRALRILDQGMKRFPDDYKMPELAGGIYAVELQTEKPEQRRAWDEQGAKLIETAVRKPNAPAGIASHAAALRTRLGQRQRAADNLREMILITEDDAARKDLLEKLAEIEQANPDQVNAELLLARKQFLDTWHAERPTMPPSLYLLVGKPIEHGFDMTSLAVGGHDMITGATFERLEPLKD